MTNKRFPQQGDCDLTDPEEHFLWALGQIQMGNTECMPIQPNTARIMSKHLYECGFRHHPKLQKKKYRPPMRGQQHYMNGLGRWVAIDAPDDEPLVLPNIRGMTTEEREWMHQELKNVGHISDPPPDRGPLAEVTSWDQLQPKERRATTVEEVMGGESA